MTNKAGADVLLVTVTQVETMAVLKAFGVAGENANAQSIDGRVYFDLGTVNGARVSMTRSEMGTAGLGASLQTVDKGIMALSPVAVFMVGIAFGLNEDQQSIGDVLVAKQLRPYDLQRLGTQESGRLHITLRDDKPHSSPWLLNLLRSSEVAWNGATLRFGTILTGAKLVDNLDFREQLRALEQEAIGGEMEGAGLYVACHDQRIDWILVKAICDFADGQKAKDKHQRQAIAADNAATFVHHALRFVKVDWSMHRHAKAIGMRAINPQMQNEEDRKIKPNSAISARRESRKLPELQFVTVNVDPTEANWSSRAVSGMFSEAYPDISFAFRKSLLVEADPTIDVTVINMIGDPPALPGRQSKFDISGSLSRAASG